MFSIPNSVRFSQAVPPNQNGTYTFRVTEVFKKKDTGLDNDLITNYDINIDATNIMWHHENGVWSLLVNEDAFEAYKRKQETLRISEMIIYPAFE